MKKELSPAQMLKQAIMLAGIKVSSYDGELTKKYVLALDSSKIDAAYEAFVLEDAYGVTEEFREGQVETGIDPYVGNHYDAKGVAAQMHDGSWVGWNYYSGGGKHGNPEDIDWIDDAYSLVVTEREETKVVIVRSFKKTKG